MGGVVAFALEHCGEQPWACIRSDADFGSGAGTAERRQAAARRLAVTLPLRLRAYCLRCERYRPRPWGEQARLARIVRSACGRGKPVHGRGAAGATVAARLRRANDDGRSTCLRRGGPTWPPEPSSGSTQTRGSASSRPMTAPTTSSFLLSHQLKRLPRPSPPRPTCPTRPKPARRDQEQET